MKLWFLFCSHNQEFGPFLQNKRFFSRVCSRLFAFGYQNILSPIRSELALYEHFLLSYPYQEDTSILILPPIYKLADIKYLKASVLRE